ncbi:hypothetical protein Taro_055669, partial [Colocasia esculenta]|nr:hypothetical protein [Colocasia esculenta]
EEEGRAWCCGVVDLALSEEEVAVHREGPSWIQFFVTGRDFLCPSRSGWIGSPSGFIDSFTAFPMLPSPLCCVWMVCGRLGIEDPVGLPPCWCRDGSARRDIRGGVGPLGRDLITPRLVVAIRLSRRASRSRQDCCHDAFLPGRNRAIAMPFPVVMVGRRRLPFQASLATPVLVRPSCISLDILFYPSELVSWVSGSEFGLLVTYCAMAPRRRPREGVAEQATRQEAGDALPPQQTQPLPQDAHSGIVPPPPPPPPQAAQGLDLTQFLKGMALFVAQHRDAPVPQGGTGKEFVVSFERAFCPTYVRMERLYQFLDLQQRDSTVVQYKARFVELGHYAPQIMADESLRTQQFVRGLTPELRQALIVACVTDLDAAYQTTVALEADTLRTRVWSAEVQTQVVPTQPRQQQGSVQATPRTTTSYPSTSAGTTAKSGSRRKFRRDKRQTEQRQQSVGSVQQPAGQPLQQAQRSFAADPVTAPSAAAAAAAGTRVAASADRRFWWVER